MSRRPAHEQLDETGVGNELRNVTHWKSGGTDEDVQTNENIETRVEINTNQCKKILRTFSTTAKTNLPYGCETWKE